MRLQIISIFLICCPLCARAQAWFCTDKGTDLFYTRYRVEDGSVKWTHVMSILETEQGISDTCMTVVYTSFIRTADGKGLENMESPVRMTAVVGRNGDVSMDIAASMVSVLRGILWKNARITAEGGVTVLPAVMVPGDTLRSAAGKVRAMGMTMNVTVSDRKVIGTDTITTPAGTFPCVVVSEHKVEKGMLRNRVTTAITWYSRGVGMVRHDTYDRNMVQETSEVLEKIVRKQSLAVQQTVCRQRYIDGKDKYGTERDYSIL